MPNSLGYDVSYRIVSQGTIRLWVDDPSEAGKSLLFLHTNGGLVPIDTEIEILSTEPANPEVDDVTPVIREIESNAHQTS